MLLSHHAEQLSSPCPYMSFQGSSNKRQQFYVNLFLLCMTRSNLRNLHATPDMMYQPWCIRYPEWEQAQSYEHKSGLTHLLPKFHGLVGNTQQFGFMGSPTPRVMNELVVVDNQRLENKITELTSLVRQLAIGQHHSSPLVRVCGMCASIEHLTNVCPTLQEIEPQRYQPPPPFKLQQPIQPSKGSGQIPSQTILSPQANMSDMTLRSGKELPQQQLKPPKDVTLEVLRWLRRKLPQMLKIFLILLGLQKFNFQPDPNLGVIYSQHAEMPSVGRDTSSL
ncbi:hypothetical protein CR513_22353, partial [Mucuna pruriens]